MLNPGKGSFNVNAHALRRSYATPDNLCAVVIEPSEFELHQEPHV
jgi:hypothetical protein